MMKGMALEVWETRQLITIVFSHKAKLTALVKLDKGDKTSLMLSHTYMGLCLLVLKGEYEVVYVQSPTITRLQIKLQF